MERNSRYVYDGWVSISEWDEHSVREAVRNIDEALTIFCLYSSTSFDWKPKYSPRSVPLVYHFENDKLKELEIIVKKLNSINNDDRIAIYRSLAWLSKGIQLNDPIVRFFFSILAIESLAMHIECDVSDESYFAELRIQNISNKEKIKKREKCIDDILFEFRNGDRSEGIKKAYFNCVVGITQILKSHIKNIFTPDEKPYNLLFKQKIQNKSLYDLRHDIAHGATDVLSEVQRERIRQRVQETERLARRYILMILKKALNIQFINPEITVSASLGPLDFIVMKGKVSSIHMAYLYS
jgi:hypothetical protein